MSMRFILNLILSLFISTGFAQEASQEHAPSENDLLAQAQRLFDDGKTQDAFILLSKEEFEYAGNVQYDYLLGVSALESGNPGTAIFSLERAIAANPQHGAALVDLARAYYTLREYGQARVEFNKVLTLNPPENLKRIVQTYLDRIDEQVKKQKNEYSLFFELATGSDDNVNNATVNPEQMNVTLSPESVARASSLYQMKLTGNWTHTINKRLTTNMQINAYRTEYPDAQFVNTAVYSGRFGLSYDRAGRASSSVFLGVNRIEVGDEVNNHNTNLSVSQRYTLNQNLLFSISMGAAQSDYPIYAYRNNRSTFANTSITIAHKAVAPLILNFDIHGSKAETTADEATWDNQRYGIQASVFSTKRHNTQFYSALSFDETDYPRYQGQSHIEKTVYLNMGLAIDAGKKWIVNPEFNYINNNSTVDLYEYQKVKGMISLKRQLI